MNPTKVKLNDLSEPPFKRMKWEQKEESGVKMNPMEVKMDGLPILPFEKILSYLSLKHQIRSRAVSRRWCQTIDSFRVKSLCFSERPSRSIVSKSRFVSGQFAQNFISSIEFESFVSTFGQSILSSLKHLRLFNLKVENVISFFQSLSSFDRLEELDMNYFDQRDDQIVIGSVLNLPMLNSIQLNNVFGILTLTLDAPRLLKVKLANSLPILDIVHGESVESLLNDSMRYIKLEKLKKLKNLKYLNTTGSEIDSTFLSSLEQLKELHLDHSMYLSELFEQKQRYGRTDLKIFYLGLIVNGPDDPMISCFKSVDDAFGYFVENPSRMADELPLHKGLDYSAIERLPLGSSTNFLNRFTDLEEILVLSPVQDVERFLGFLEDFKHITVLNFYAYQPQDLFDRLPDHHAVQSLRVWDWIIVSDFRFLLRLKHLVSLFLNCPTDLETVRNVLEKLDSLSNFTFMCGNKKHASIRIDHPGHFVVSIGENKAEVVDPNAVIQFIVANAIDVETSDEEEVDEEEESEYDDEEENEDNDEEKNEEE